MMREILFRGKRVSDGEWAEGFYIRADHHWHNRGIHKDWIALGASANGGWFALHKKYAVQNETVGQFTGLVDKNGRKIFDGDIVQFHLFRGEPDYVGEVVYDSSICLYMLVGVGHDGFPFAVQVSSRDKETFEVIGNIHDNPELIGGGEDATD